MNATEHTPGSESHHGLTPLDLDGLSESARSVGSGVANEKPSLTLRFEAPSTPLSINKANRMHWAAKKRELDPWRELVAWAWLQERKNWSDVLGKPCVVQVVLPFRTKQRRDPHNYTGTVVKALVDTLVKQGVWPDDTPEWVTVSDPVCEIGTEARVVLTVR